MTRGTERKELELLEDIAEALMGIAAAIDRVVALLVPQATTAILSLQGDPLMPNVELDFTDGTTDQAAPKGDGTGLVVTFASDGTTTPGPAAVGTNAAGFVNYAAVLTVVDDGSVSNLSATVANTSGTPLLDDDGVTSFVQPRPVAFTAPAAPPPAQATTATLTVTS